MWGIGLFLTAGGESAPTNDLNTGLVVNPRIQFRYLRSLNKQLYIGANWDLINFYYNKLNGLGNNGNYFIASSNLFASGIYKMGKWEFGVDLGLLALVKEGTGFAFSAPQKGLEKGEFDYQNEALENPFSPKYSSFHSTFDHFQLRTNIKYQLSDRWSLAYQWNVRKFAEVENLPITYGGSSLAIRFNIIHKNKTAAGL